MLAAKVLGNGTTDRSDNSYEGPVVTVEVGGSKIETTVYHPFWVVEGENLDDRAVPRELLPEEDEGKSLKGRWVNSHDLRAGDKIFTLSGKLETIKAVSQRFEESFAVCNLTIEERHNYAVGLCGVLVHNVSLCGANPVFRELGEGFAEYADDLFRQLSPGDMRSVTIAVSRVLENGVNKVIVVVNGGASPSAVATLKKIVEESGGIFRQAPGRTHAEKFLYDLFGNSLKAIGISHWKGPCPICRPFFKSVWPNIHWTGVWK